MHIFYLEIMAPAKLDFKKQFPLLYNPSSKQVEFVDIEPMKFFMLDGKGDPNTSEDYQKTLSVLYGASFSLKMSFKKKPQGKDYVVPPLEGLWYMEDMENWSMDNKKDWKWTMMIMIPDFIPDNDISNAVEQFTKKKPELEDFIEKLRIETYHEGTCAQIMHIGPYDAEPPTIKKLHSVIKSNKYELTGHHHEIYLSDPRRCNPERLKTVIRQPYK